MSRPPPSPQRGRDRELHSPGQQPPALLSSAGSLRGLPAALGWGRASNRIHLSPFYLNRFGSTSLRHHPSGSRAAILMPVLRHKLLLLVRLIVRQGPCSTALVMPAS
ncbi:hypothetical protein NDU88_002360 [Pleurodeles waltl]|uniref:Uncharacterized protein n=1 Tax=Pleurodeles waltl TaxID=8319 RepID=A0AAV7NDT2_PLEWA|nr:hypothetical protein NDU88_002360 [Pleurodeles waltl]